MTSRYDAFISYSHAADEQLAPAIQRGLHQLARRWNQRRALDVFVDTTGLAADPALWSSIKQAMDGARYFILLASPEAAASEWVNREIAYWIETKASASILPVLTDGEWWWDATANDFDWAASSAVPAALRGVFAEEPRHVDLRWARSETDLSLRHSRFRDQIAELAAPIHGMGKDEIEGEDVRRHRFVRRLTRVVGGALVTLTIVAAATSLMALANAEQARQEAERARLAESEARDAEAEAERQARVAEDAARRAHSRALAAQAELLDAEPDLQLLLHVAALDLDPDPFNQRALLRTLLSRPLVGYWRPDRPEGPFASRLSAVDPSGEIALFTGDRGRMEVWNLKQRELLVSRVLAVRDPGTPNVTLGVLSTIPQGGVPANVEGMALPLTPRIILSSVHGLVLWRPPPDEVDVFFSDCWSIAVPRPLAVLPDGRMAAAACDDPDLADGEISHGIDIYYESSRPMRISLPGPATGIDFAPDGAAVAVAVAPDLSVDPRGHTRVALYDTAHGELQRTIRLDTGGEAFVRFSPDGDVLVIGGLNGTLYSIDVSRFSVASEVLRAHTSGVTSLAFDPAGQLLVTGDAGGMIAVWNVLPADGDRAKTLQRSGSFTGHANGVQAIAVEDESRFVSIGQDAVVLWDLSTSLGAARLVSGDVRAVAALPDGSIVYPTPNGLVKTSLVDLTRTELWIRRDFVHLDAGVGDRLDRLAFDLVRFVASADGQVIAGSDVDLGVFVWHVNTRELVRAVPITAISLAITFDGSLVSVGNLEGGGGLYEVDSGRLVVAFSEESHIQASAFSPDGRLLFYADRMDLAGEDVLKVLDVQCERVIIEHPVGAYVEDVDVSPDGRMVAVGTGSTVIRRRPAQGSVLTYEVGAHGGMGSTDCGTPSQLELRELGTFAASADGVRSLAFDPGSGLLAAGTWDGRLLIIDTQSGERVAFTDPLYSDGPVTELVFSEPGVLVSTGREGITLHDWRVESLRHRACTIAGRVFTDPEQDRFLADFPTNPCAPE